MSLSKAALSLMRSRSVARGVGIFLNLGGAAKRGVAIIIMAITEF